MIFSPLAVKPRNIKGFRPLFQLLQPVSGSHPQYLPVENAGGMIPPRGVSRFQGRRCAQVYSNFHPHCGGTSSATAQDAYHLLFYRHLQVVNLCTGNRGEHFHASKLFLTQECPDRLYSTGPRMHFPVFLASPRPSKLSVHLGLLPRHMMARREP